jgi:hypothetical protein
MTKAGSGLGHESQTKNSANAAAKSDGTHHGVLNNHSAHVGSFSISAW